MSWNVHGLPFQHDAPARLDRIVEKVREQQPDIVPLQEVWLGSYVTQLGSRLKPDYVPVYQGRWVGRFPCGGLVVFVRCGSGWTPSKSTFTPFTAHGSRRRIREFDGLGGKGILAVQLCRDRQRLMIVDTHLQAQYPESNHFYRRVRTKQLDQLARFLREQLATEPVLIVGDFNTTPDERIYTELMSPLGIDLTADTRQRSGGGTRIDSRTGDRIWIDYAIARNFSVSAEVAGIRNDAADVPYSDHDGLLVRLLYDGMQIQ